MADKEIVVYFTNGRMVRVPEGKERLINDGQRAEDEYKQAVANGDTVINWKNVCMMRRWIEPEDIDP